MQDNRVILSVGIIFVFLVGIILGYATGNKECPACDEWSYDKGWSDGISYQATVDVNNIVLGLVKLPSGYYIVNKNYGNFRVNTTDQIEAIGRLSEEISPC